MPYRFDIFCATNAHLRHQLKYHGIVPYRYRIVKSYRTTESYPIGKIDHRGRHITYVAPLKRGFIVVKQSSDVPKCFSVVVKYGLTVFHDSIDVPRSEILEFTLRTHYLRELKPTE